MVDIARQTVEFLYEENGGIPRDLYLPTIEDIKDEANKFTIDKVRKGNRDACMKCKTLHAISSPKLLINGTFPHLDYVFTHRVDRGHPLP